jgi:outer membrane protein assembly factor BamE (lipoprotein component of BamABCDE complex)
MQRSIRVGLAALVLAGAAGCSSRSAEQPAPADAAVASVPPPADSKLAQVKVGMTKKQVTDILGPPTDETSYQSGKAWIPFYYGNDVRRTSYFYKGVGRVVFADGNAFGGGSPEVVRVDYDPSESGVAR